MKTINITYIGHRPVYKDGACGSGATFERGQTLQIPAQFAMKMLKHPGVYVKAEKAAAKSAPVVEVEDKKPNEKRADEFNREQDMRDSIEQMDKEALKVFAMTHWRMDLDASKTVKAMRAEVSQNFDRFGVAG